MAEITSTIEAVEIVTVEAVEVLQVVSLEHVEIGQQGPRGIQGPVGPQGPIGDSGGALLVNNRLNEFSTAQMKIEARTNLELNNIDCGEFL